MTKQSAGQPAIALTPHLSLRQAVRPLIFAHALLSREQERAGELAAECDRMLELTRKLLEATALVHLLVPGDNGVATDGAGSSRQSQLVDAYANAGIMWAQVVGCAVALADTLISQGRWDDVRRLAGFLEAAEETTAAEDLRTRAGAAVRRASEARLAHINAKMSEGEIAMAIEVLEEVKDADAVSFYIRDLALAIFTALPSSWRQNYDAPVPEDFSFTISWQVRAGVQVMKGQRIGHFRQVSDQYYSSSYSSTTYGITLAFPAVIVELLAQEGANLTGPVPIVSFIEIPGPIADEISRTETSSQMTSSRLEALARVFRQIQAENKRTRERRA